MQDEGWREAVQKELNALEKFNVWTPCELPISEKAIETRWIISTRHLDISTAFLNGEIQSTVYMKPPEGTNRKRGVLKLKKAMYDLR
ncbi:hypothetical protein PR048_007382 [Dryococelus australis]|uniref:Reverse transcriptase Ty1/copia-type domain-containing protein n=1 Tax=Dryococelus australis TaxID=614101 RepID=A0ABQ9HU39_9NEOP|nr:hypothetical protein PR048_007382 [Dryococelus australis]